MDLDFEKALVELEQEMEEISGGTDRGGKLDSQVTQLKRKITTMRKKLYTSLTPWQTVQVARHPERPTLRDYIAGVFSEFIELHGDRAFGDDKGIIGGFATVDKQRVMLIGHQKGKTTEDNIACNFGMANPEGYRKALRLMKLAEKYNLPVVSLIDTPGAYPGMEAEARGQAEAIARNLTEMSRLQVPVIVLVTGEGGSGGAIGIGVGNVILMLSHAVYSVISPEGCASILWRDNAKAPEAAAALKITADELLKLGIVDEIIEEPLGGAHRNHQATFESVKACLLNHISRLKKHSTRRLVEQRFKKFAAIGKYDSRKYAAHR